MMEEFFSRPPWRLSNHLKRGQEMGNSRSFSGAWEVLGHSPSQGENESRRYTLRGTLEERHMTALLRALEAGRVGIVQLDCEGPSKNFLRHYEEELRPYTFDTVGKNLSGDPVLLYLFGRHRSVTQRARLRFFDASIVVAYTIHATGSLPLTILESLLREPLDIPQAALEEAHHRVAKAAEERRANLTFMTARTRRDRHDLFRLKEHGQVLSGIEIFEYGFATEREYAPDF